MLRRKIVYLSRNALGSARDSRAGFGDSPKQSSSENTEPFSAHESSRRRGRRRRHASRVRSPSSSVRGQGRVDVRENEDRKSTRLNSSHRCISYAVFCLKK